MPAAAFGSPLVPCSLSLFVLEVFVKDRIKQWFPNARLEVLTGLTVALALVPEAIAFAFVAKVDRSSGCSRRSSCASSRRCSAGDRG